MRSQQAYIQRILMMRIMSSAQHGGIDVRSELGWVSKHQK